jgi:hypothetical protein
MIKRIIHSLVIIALLALWATQTDGTLIKIRGEHGRQVYHR